MDNQANNSPIRYLVLVIFALVATTLTTTAYFGFKTFLEDREELLLQNDVPIQPMKNQPLSTRQTKTYTAEELEDLRKQGKSPTGIQQPGLPHQTMSNNEAAVQRSLKALEEINRINQMNQQLMEQQQRMNRQQK